jgi:hypothetical protein
MTDSAETAPGTVAAPPFDPKVVLRSVLLSIFINGVMPFLVYKLLEPHFPPHSVVPFIYASAFPLLGLIATYLRARIIDTIAIIALFGICYSIVSALLAGDLRLAMIVSATQGFVIAAAFLVSALIKRPIMFFIVRQFVAGNDPERRAFFARVNEADGGHTYFIATMIWAGGIAFLGCAALALAATLPAGAYLLVNNIVNTTVNIVLVVWSLRYVQTNIGRIAERLERN